jgi:hypothetical protein
MKERGRLFHTYSRCWCCVDSIVLLYGNDDPATISWSSSFSFFSSDSEKVVDFEVMTYLPVKSTKTIKCSNVMA